jgi:hypothetical protein
MLIESFAGCTTSSLLRLTLKCLRERCFLKIQSVANQLATLVQRTGPTIDSNVTFL